MYGSGADRAGTVVQGSLRRSGSSEDVQDLPGRECLSVHAAAVGGGYDG